MEGGVMYTVNVHSLISNILERNFRWMPMWPNGERDVGGVVTRCYREHRTLRSVGRCGVTVRGYLHRVLCHGLQKKDSGAFICLSRGGDMWRSAVVVVRSVLTL